MAAKKETPHTFEYFKTSEVFINGRFKEYGRRFPKHWSVLGCQKFLLL